tara:strand:+ start:105 stop:809 length:705 start_codon:yes stop_codon:yes gene_type:complete
MKYCIDQPGCLGDILFTLKIGEVLSEKGEVDWFVNPSFWESGISRLKTSFNLSPNAPRYVEGAEKISLCNLTDRPDPDLMLKKYAVVDMDWSDWSSYVKYDRDYDKENELREFLGIQKGEKYILLNDMFGMYNVHKGVQRSIPEEYDGKIIKMNVYNEATVFDWCGIFENAEEIHTVDTSILLIIETLKLKAKKMVMHPRHYKYTFPQLGKLFKKPWEWVEYTEQEWKELCPNG